MPLSGLELTRSAALRRFSGLRILVFGDIILDRYLWGEVERISPEAPVPVVVESRRTELPGGALNVARNLVAAGAKAEMVGAIGADLEGRIIQKQVKSLGIGRKGLIVDHDRPTTLKTRVMSQGQQMFRLDREDSGRFGAEIEAKLLASVTKLLPSCDAVVLSDYRKGIVSRELAAAVIEKAKKQGIVVIADPKQNDFRHYRGADYLTPNLREAIAATGKPLATQKELEREGKKLVKKFAGKAIAITRGHEGVSLLSSGAPVHIPAQAKEVFDVTGAGDTFISHLALGLAAGIEPAQAAMIANAASGVAVSKLGAVTVAPEELAAALGGEQALSKLRTAEDLCLTLEHHRQQNRRVVFTNGCFDLFHAAHVRLLHEARALGDVLVVAMNTDRSVQRIKGKPRPILPEDERAAVLSALEVVDYVVFFGEDSPEKLLRMLKPDVLVKGKQKQGAPIVGADIVTSYGGEVVQLPLYQASSTGDIVRKIRRAPKKRAALSKKLRTKSGAKPS